ncbi:PREDICTED: reverse mRNAase [Prunus dulcis]|uniref:PREDICTED: reverse mRNAase n=1 Tax=Prunus dulcis TaxID=3755 RepID=A0A5E4E8H9_PRUDU|nr:PREDICTED: reverse mRNAase [Prunus dulcis]
MGWVTLVDKRTDRYGWALESIVEEALRFVCPIPRISFHLGYNISEWGYGGGKVGHICAVNGRISADYGHILTCHLVALGSDHYPILGELLNETPTVEAKKKRRFHFEQMRTLKKGCEDIIREDWDSTVVMGGVKEQIKNCAGKLAEWNKLTFGHVQKQLAAAHKELEVLQGRMGQDQVLVERTIVVLLEK